MPSPSTGSRLPERVVQVNTRVLFCPGDVVVEPLPAVGEPLAWRRFVLQRAMMEVEANRVLAERREARVVALVMEVRGMRSFSQTRFPKDMPRKIERLPVGREGPRSVDADDGGGGLGSNGARGGGCGGGRRRAHRLRPATAEQYRSGQPRNRRAFERSHVPCHGQAMAKRSRKALAIVWIGPAATPAGTVSAALRNESA